MFGLIFDFDGLILDTEVPVFDAWAEIYAEFGLTLSHEKWGVCVGSTDIKFNPCVDLAEQLGAPVDCAGLRNRHREAVMGTLQNAEPLPGVVATLEAARDIGMRVGLASSSPRWWVEPHLERLGLRSHFQCVKTCDDVTNTKPDPELFVAAMRELGVQPERTIVLEDSPNGITAARAAGAFSVVVPNGVTRHLGVEHAHLRIESLMELSLSELVRRLDESVATLKEEPMP